MNRCEDCKFFSAIDVTTRTDRMRQFACTCWNESSDNYLKPCPNVACKDFVKRETMNQLCYLSSADTWIPICTFINPTDYLVTEAEEACPNLEKCHIRVNVSFSATMTVWDYEHLKKLKEAENDR